MKLGIIGLSQSGKNTVFEALTHNFSFGIKSFDDRLGVVKVVDDRINLLSNMYNPKKTISAQVEYFLPSNKGQKITKHNSWDKVRNCDALVNIINNFDNYSLETKPMLYSDFNLINQELILSDTIIVENRIERLALDKKRGKKINPEELFLLKQCLSLLEKALPLRDTATICNSKLLKGYTFLSAKPILTLINNSDENDEMPNDPIINETYCMIIRAKLEQEVAQMDEKDSIEFLKEFKISAPAINKVITASYSLLGLISFFTVGEDEVRAWTIKANTTACDAAEVIHSDIKKGFIRAELVSYDDLVKAGSYSEARKKGKVRLEGKTYIIRDGDIINFRFNV